MHSLSQILIFSVELIQSGKRTWYAESVDTYAHLMPMRQTGSAQPVAWLILKRQASINNLRDCPLQNPKNRISANLSDEHLNQML
jgi:hypothetical protein